MSEKLIPVLENPDGTEVVEDISGGFYLPVPDEEFDELGVPGIEEEYGVTVIQHKGRDSLESVSGTGKDFAEEVKPNSPAVVYAPENELGSFGDPIAKTGNSVVRNYVNRLGGVMGTAVVAENYSGDTAYQHLAMEDETLENVPIVSSVDEALEQLEETPEYFVLGIAVPGGEMNEEWEKDIEAAMEAGMNIVTGFHNPLGEREEWQRKALANDVMIYDTRKSPGKEELSVAHGEIDGATEDHDEIDTPVVFSTGLDCGIGKRTAQNAVAKAAETDGYEVCRIGTGQTGVMLGADRAVPVDSLPADFLAGAVQQLILEEEKEGDADIYLVEGQSAATHPAYGQLTLGIFHGVNPDALILSHDPERESLEAFPEKWEYPDIDRELGLLEKAVGQNREFPPVAGVNLHGYTGGQTDLEISGRYTSKHLEVDSVMRKSGPKNIWKSVKRELGLGDEESE